MNKQPNKIRKPKEQEEEEKKKNKLYIPYIIFQMQQGNEENMQQNKSQLLFKTLLPVFIHLLVFLILVIIAVV